ncbi:hypothetical protein MIR68_009543 [Amoeboaphelidium protococcarum]|nr:hypothetical protein MIR68_009543 [Amoeboaphelidium protococcarum]
MRAVFLFALVPLIAALGDQRVQLDILEGGTAAKLKIDLRADNPCTQALKSISYKVNQFDVQTESRKVIKKMPWYRRNRKEIQFVDHPHLDLEIKADIKYSASCGFVNIWTTVKPAVVRLHYSEEEQQLKYSFTNLGHGESFSPANQLDISSDQMAKIIQGHSPTLFFDRSRAEIVLYFGDYLEQKQISDQVDAALEEPLNNRAVSQIGTEGANSMYNLQSELPEFVNDEGLDLTFDNLQSLNGNAAPAASYAASVSQIGGNQGEMELASQYSEAQGSALADDAESVDTAQYNAQPEVPQRVPYYGRLYNKGLQRMQSFRQRYSRGRGSSGFGSEALPPVEESPLLDPVPQGETDGFGSDYVN